MSAKFQRPEEPQQKSTNEIILYWMNDDYIMEKRSVSMCCCWSFKTEWVPSSKNHRFRRGVCGIWVCDECSVRWCGVVMKMPHSAKKHFLLPASFKLIVLRCVLCVSIFTQASEIRNERKQLHSDRFWFHIETECGHYFVCVNLNFNFARMKLTLFARLGCSSFGSLFRIEHWLWYTHVYIPDQIHTLFIAIRHLPFTTSDFIGFVHRK